jgi:NAD-dependent SIR2 family protein deacetylase
LDPYNAEDLLNLAHTAELSGLRFPAPVRGLFVDAEWVRRMLVWAILMLLERRIAERLPALYSDFIAALRPSDSIITLNYDIIIETCLGDLRGAFDYALPREMCVVEWPSMDVLSDTPVLKLHGSMNWMRCFPSNASQQACGKVYVRPLAQVYAYGGDTFEACTCGQGGLEALIVPPTHVKAFGGSPLERVWKVAGKELRAAAELFVIGYSLPRADVHVRELLRLARIKNPALAVTVVNPDPGCVANFDMVSDLPSFTYRQESFGAFVANAIRVA